MDTAILPKPFIPKITDPALVAKLRKAAKRAKRADWRAYSNEMVERALKMVLGMEVDLRPKDVAQELGIHLNSFWNYHKMGMFPSAYYTPTRRLRVPYKDIAALKERTARAAASTSN